MDEMRETETRSALLQKTTSSASADAPARHRDHPQRGDGSTGSMAEQGTPAPGQVASSASEMASKTYEQGQRLAQQASERYPATRGYYQESRRAVSHGVTEAPLSTLLAGAAMGYVLAWAVHGHQSTARTRMPHRAGQRRDRPGQRSGQCLIASDRVEGTAVYDPSGNRIGTIQRVMIEKISGRVAYAVMSFGGFLGLGQEEHAIPWRKLDYDTSLEGYRTDITEEQLRNAPSFSRDQDHDWSDRQQEQDLHDYYRVTAYWIVT